MMAAFNMYQWLRINAFPFYNLFDNLNAYRLRWLVNFLIFSIFLNFLNNTNPIRFCKLLRYFQSKQSSKF